MNKKMVWLAGLSLALTVGVVSCVSATKTQDRNVAGIIDIIKEWHANSGYAQDFGGGERPHALDSKYIAKHSSTGKLPIDGAELIIDNDAAFDAKVEAIQKAKNSIRMSYFIYADDDSSSIITSELIKKAKEGIKVKLLVDFITNYKSLDLYQMMVNEGNGNIDIRFYNFPSERLQADAKYMTLPCPETVKPDSDTCSTFKQNIMKSLSKTESTFFSKLFLSGLYGKNGAAMKVALGLGAQIDPEKYKSKEPASEEDVARLMEFFKLYFEAKVQGNIISMIKLSIAMFMYGEELNPVVNELTGRLPMMNDKVLPGRKTTHAQEWDHLTDYTHHKLIVVDGKKFQLGGRNIEDSYHMKSRLGTKGKYIFMDTDFFAETVPGGAVSIERSFDKTFNFREMVAPIAEVQRIMPADLTLNNEALLAASGGCFLGVQLGKVKPEQMASCIEAKMVKHRSYVGSAARIAKLKSEVQASVARYNNEYAGSGKKVLRDNWKGSEYAAGINKLSAKDVKTADVYYIENTSFNVKEKDAADVVRRAGSKIGAESFFNKHIHKLWYRGLENTCYVSQKEKRDLRVVLHTAYLFLPSGMLHQLTKMINGDYGNCSRVHITLLTNSFATTDLNVINVFARYQMAQLFRHYEALVANTANQKSFVPKLDYFEYNAESVGTGVSLHTKLSLLGDDMIVGSANADTRSYGMDTNNAVFIRNAHDLNRDYTAFIDGLIGDRKKTTTFDSKYTRSSSDDLDALFKVENDYILGAMICRWDKKATNCPALDKLATTPMRATKVSSPRFTPERVAQMLEAIDKLGARVTYATYKILNFRGEFDEMGHFNGGRYGNNQTQDAPLEKEFNKIANEFDDLFKVL